MSLAKPPDLSPLAAWDLSAGVSAVPSLCVGTCGAEVTGLVKSQLRLYRKQII